MKGEGRSSNKDGENKEISYSSSVGLLIAGAYALEALTDAIRFNEFLRGKSISKRNLLPGMKLIFENLIENLILQVGFNEAFTLDSDRITQRALFKGIPIERAMSNSSLAKLLRGLEKAKEKVCKENTVPDFHITMSEELSPLFKAVEDLFQNHIEVRGNISRKLDKKVVLNLLCYSWYLRFINIKQEVRTAVVERVWKDLEDLLGGFEENSNDEMNPRTIKHSKEREKEITKERKKLDRCIVGWKTCTAYFWAQLKDNALPIAPIDSVLQCKSWEDLDDLFRPVADGPVAEVDKILRTGMGKVFKRVTECNPKSLESLMIEYNPIIGDDQKTCLDNDFLWHEFEILDGAQPKIFPGVSTFTNLLVGTVSMRELLNWSDLIEIRRILHPAGYHFYKKEDKRGKKKKFDVGYAILIPAFSTIADYSGWLISLDCCNNYSGFASGMRAQAESFIKLYQKKHLAVKDIIISRNDFRQYLRSNMQERHNNPFSRLSRSELETIKLEESIELGTEMSAFIIELFMATTVAEAGFDIHWQYRNNEVIGKREIDILAVREQEVQIIECSRHLPIGSEGIIEKIQELQRKRKYIENSDFKRKRITLRYITTKDLDDKRFKQTTVTFRKAGISIENIYQILEKSQHRTKPLHELLSQLENLRMLTDDI